MQTEIEAKFLRVDVPELRERLKNLNAVQEYPEQSMRRIEFDYPDMRLEKIGGWIRLRDEGLKVTLSYKQLNDRSLHGTKEINLVVSDFEKTAQFFLAIGFQQAAYRETKRELWKLDGVEITIDTWPWISTFVELEGESEGLVRQVAEKIGFDWKNALFGSVEIAYQAEYDVTEEDVDHWESITFTPVPDWLESKRKKTS